MMLNEVTKAAGAHRKRKRVGRGESSGWGKTATRGNKGCQSRSGGLVRPLTEGGQMPTFRRLPKRGFNNAQFCKQVEIVNLADLERTFHDGDTVDVAALSSAGLVRTGRKVKVLAQGTCTKKLTVHAHAFSASAQEALGRVGGTAKVIACPTPAEKARAKRNSRKAQAPAKKTTESAGVEVRKPAAKMVRPEDAPADVEEKTDGQDPEKPADN